MPTSYPPELTHVPLGWGTRKGKHQSGKEGVSRESTPEPPDLDTDITCFAWKLRSARDAIFESLGNAALNLSPWSGSPL